MIFDIGCLCHLAHLCVGRGAKEFSIDRYYHFCRSAKRKNLLKEFINFNNNKVRKVINCVLQGG